MGKVLIIGCGGVASVAIQKCCQNSEVFEEICIASRTKSKCDALKKNWKARRRRRLPLRRWMPTTPIRWRRSSVPAGLTSS